MLCVNTWSRVQAYVKQVAECPVCVYGLSPAVCRALFRVAQKHHWCSTKADRAACTADTKTPCSWIDDDKVAYLMGLARNSTSMAQCVYFTQGELAMLAAQLVRYA